MCKFEKLHIKKGGTFMIELIVEEFEQLANLLEERCRVISIGNQKGGVGKSSLVRLLPSVLAFSGKKFYL